MKNEETLDEEYKKSVPKEYRKKYGQFLTPQNVANFMVKWGLDNGAKEILDPSVGTGIFFSEMLKSKRRIQSFLGIDIDTSILKVAEIRRKLLGREFKESNKVELLVQDFFNLEDDMKFDFIICNPPYMKFHSYDNKNLVSRIEQKIGAKLSKLTNLYTLFFINSLPFLKDNGVMAFITPAEFLYTNYGRELKRFLMNNFAIDAIILSDFERPVFNGVLTSATVTLLRKGTVSNEHKVKFIKVKNWNSHKEIFDAVYNSKISNGIFLNEINQKKLNPEDKWLSFFEEASSTLSSELNSNLIPLKNITKVKRGIATGFNKFFTLSEKEVWQREIEKKFLQPVLSNAKHCRGYNLSKEEFEELVKKDEKVFLLYCFENPDEHLRKYIAYGEKIGVNKRYLTSKRSPWFSMERRKPAKILATVFSRDKMRFILNEADVLNLASFHGVYPTFNEPNKIKALLAYLNSNEAKKIMALQKRTYGGGLDKFEPRDLENIYVLNINKINPSAISELSSLFDDLCSSKTKTEEDEVKLKIDASIKEILQN